MWRVINVLLLLLIIIILNYTEDFHDFRICNASREDVRCLNKFRKSRNKWRRYRRPIAFFRNPYRTFREYVTSDFIIRIKIFSPGKL